MKKGKLFLALSLFLIFTLNATGQIKTNKDKLLTIAVQGVVAPARVATSYTTTWDGKAKLAIGVGGINYDLKLGEKIFGWASGDRATMGVATTGEGGAWSNYTSIGNVVKILGGEARGEKGVIIGKFENYVLVHFPDEVLEKLTIGTSLHVKASGIGLEIEGYKDVFAHSISPETLEKLGIRESNGKLEVPVVKEIPALIIGQGAGRGSLSGNWHIQTCFPPDIKKYGLDELRFGDIVILKDIQTDYGMGYYKGGATIGVICSGPSDISGLGIGVTPILSNRFGKITARIDPTANIAKVLSIKTGKSSKSSPSSALKTNKDQLLTIAVQGVVNPASSRGYSTTHDGKPIVHLGMGSINYTVSVGDLAYGWANADHVEPDVSFTNLDGPALGILGCIGNEAKLISGEAKGAKGIYIGKHGSSMFWFPKDILEQLSVNDKIQVKAKGVGLKIDGFEDVRVNKISPELLENIGITVEGDQLVVPVVKTVPGHIMGSGMGLGFFVLENVDYDIHTTCPQTVEEYDLKTLRLGDLVAIQDHYDFYGRGRYEGAMTIGVVIHGWSDVAGHGPGLDPILSALPGRIKVKIDPDANTAYYLGIKEKPLPEEQE
ncbi:MAG: DUF4438 domain-containing protein [Candidatus Aminicenantes bacterium]|nr:MAG: DUF4438 domain-containing protein [Candidatus Aminicenantes bacterium]